MSVYPANSPIEADGLYAEHHASLSARHDAALERCAADCLVIFSGRPRTAFLDDQDYPFVCNPHFLAWVPLDALPMSYIVYRPGDRPKLIYYQPQDYWHVVPAEPGGSWTRHFDIRIVRNEEELQAHAPKDPENCILLGEIDVARDALGIKHQNPAIALDILHYARGRKTSYELACMRQASERGVRGHRAAEAAFREGRSEFEIHQAYGAAVGHADSELPYPNIIALNAHGAILHYTNLDRVAPDDYRSLLIDAGARVCGYAADITRTYAFEDPRFADLIRLVDELQRELISRIHPGVSFVDLHVEAHRLIAEVLLAAGLARGTADELLELGITAAFFPHGLGHLLGLQVHDVGGHLQDEKGTLAGPPREHPYLRLTRVLEENMVLTVEPGLYAIDMLLAKLEKTPAKEHVVWSAVDWLRDYGGIRIEDNVRVSADGCENLTRAAFAHSN